MKKLYLIATFILSINSTHAQTMFVRPLVGNQTSYPVPNIQKLTFVNGNIIVNNESGPNGTFPLADNRYINFTDLTLDTISSSATENKIFVYPNPSSQWLNINSSNYPHHMPSLVEIISIDGKLLIQQISTTLEAQIDISTLPQGIYLCKITCNNQKQAIKFIKQ